jgi:hypothetical protein
MLDDEVETRDVQQYDIIQYIIACYVSWPRNPWFNNFKLSENKILRFSFQVLNFLYYPS